MRSLMIKHAAKITAINPSAARFAHERNALLYACADQRS